MKRLAVCSILCGCALLGWPGAATAEEVLDVSFLEGLGSRANFGGISYAQTFTVGVGGTLSGVAVEVIQLENVSLQILETVNGVPSSSPSAVLATAALPDVPFNPSNVLVQADVSATGIAVNPGDVLAIAIVGGLDGIKNWRAAFESTSETYPDGAAFIRVLDQEWIDATCDDYNFQTYVEVDTSQVPAAGPPGYAILLLALLGLGGAIHLRRSGDGHPA